MPRISGVHLLLTTLVAMAIWFGRRWWLLERPRARVSELRPGDLATGFVTDFFDTLGIGAFAPTTAIFKLQRRMADDEIPGTLNVGHALPTIVEGLIFIAIVTLDLTTLVPMLPAAVLGAWLGRTAGMEPARVLSDFTGSPDWHCGDQPVSLAS